jgi:hypothetical protein
MGSCNLQDSLPSFVPEREHWVHAAAAAAMANTTTAPA